MSFAMAFEANDRHVPVAIENGGGAGALVLICDHASHFIPSRYAGLGLGEEDRKRHIGWDIGALELSRQLSQRLGAPLFHATLSRLLLDLNRRPDAHDAIVEISEDIAIPGNRALDAEERAYRRDWIYEPYHAAIEALIARRIADARAVGVVALHSFTPVYRGRSRPWQIGVLSQRDRRMADAMIDALRRDPGLQIGDNQPYAPTDGVYHTLERHAEAHGLPCVMLEVRNDLIHDSPGQAAWADRLAPLLQRAFEAAIHAQGAVTQAPQS
jgi:predicted N-formylglutamate amidohydrolase